MHDEPMQEQHALEGEGELVNISDLLKAPLVELETILLDRLRREVSEHVFCQVDEYLSVQRHTSSGWLQLCMI